MGCFELFAGYGEGFGYFEGYWDFLDHFDWYWVWHFYDFRFDDGIWFSDFNWVRYRNWYFDGVRFRFFNDDLFGDFYNCWWQAALDLTTQFQDIIVRVGQFSVMRVVGYSFELRGTTVTISRSCSCTCQTADCKNNSLKQ